ncbi:MAG TPA: tripartite tricarboxylate transporter substrate binding protein [Eoetvoesiella sp.]
MKLKKIIIPFMLAATALTVNTAQAAEAYPTRPIKMIVGFPPGGGTDVLARALSAELTTALGQSVVVENRGGANGVIGTAELAKSAPDGYTVMMTISSHVTNALLQSNLTYSLKDFTPITVVARSPFVLAANTKFGPNNVKDLIAVAQSKPGTINYGSPGTGSTQHLSHELMNLMSNIDMVHVPYRGGAPAMNDLIANQISLMFVTTVQSLPFLEQKRLKALAVSSEKRVAALPDVPTISETVPGYSSDVWFGVIAPAGTPEPIVNRLQTEIVKIFKTPEMQKRLATQGAEPVGSTPKEFADLIQAEYVKWGDVFKKTGIKAE